MNIKKRFLAAFAAAVVLAAAGAAASVYLDRVYQRCIAEAGTKVTVDDFVKREGELAEFVPERKFVDTDIPGEYPLHIRCGIVDYSVVLEVRDTIPPKARAASRTIEMGEELEAEEFVTEIEDMTEVKISYLEKPDFQRYGRQEVGILLMDAGENATVLKAQLTISKVRKMLTMEAGDELPASSDFLLAEGSAAFLEGIEDVDKNVPGDYEIALSVDGERFPSTLHIEDTIAPEAEVRNLEGYTLVKREPEEFIVEGSVRDVSEVTVSYLEEPDFTYEGTQKVVLVLADASGNETRREAGLTLKKDTEAPVISGARNMTVLIGDSISYKKNVAVSDNCDAGLAVSVDAGAVNLNAEGTYPVIYRARDTAGNTAEVEVTLTVRPKSYDIEAIYAEADVILSQIITPGMSQHDKAYAIYNWIKRNIRYADHSPKASWQQGAYDGLVKRRGDCYTYAMTAKVLLGRAGIPNVDIAKIPARTCHYWNVVDIGSGPLHFDTTPRLDHPTIFLWTDEQLMKYSAKHNNSHNYDKNIYTMFGGAEPAQETPADAVPVQEVGGETAAENAPIEAGGEAAAENAPIEVGGEAAAENAPIEEAGEAAAENVPIEEAGDAAAENVPGEAAADAVQGEDIQAPDHESQPAEGA